MIIEKMLDSLLDEELAKGPQAEKKKLRSKLVDPLAKYPLGRQEIIDAESDSPIGRHLTKNDWRFY